MDTCNILLKFSKTRQAHFEYAGHKTASKMKAIGKIQQVADFFSGKNETVQLRAVHQVEREIMEILPSEGSRYQKLRQNMLDLLDRAQSIQP